MIAPRIYKSSCPMPKGGPLQPMSKDDATFWQLFRERQQTNQQSVQS
jgi:hypothetical protein